MNEHVDHPRMADLLEEQEQQRLHLVTELEARALLPEDLPSEPEVQVHIQSVSLSFDITEMTDGLTIARAMLGTPNLLVARQAGKGLLPLPEAAALGVKATDEIFGPVELNITSKDHWSFRWRTDSYDVWIHAMNPFKIRRELTGYRSVTRNNHNGAIKDCRWVQGSLPFSLITPRAALATGEPPGYTFALPQDWSPTRLFGELSAE